MLNITESNTTERLWDYFHDHYDTDDYTNQYVLDVLSLANLFGIVPKWAAIKLFRDHGSSELDYIRDGNQKYNALQILSWLGYWCLLCLHTSTIVGSMSRTYLTSTTISISFFHYYLILMITESTIILAVIGMIGLFSTAITYQRANRISHKYYSK